MKPLMSVVMAYHNRKPLLLQTLRSIGASEMSTFCEVVIVDDGSSQEHRLENIQEELQESFGVQLDIKVIRIEPEDKWYSNPCIPFNRGFKEAQGDVIIIQNPECYHLGDVLTIASQVQSNQYLSFHCYSLNQSVTDILPTVNPNKVVDRGLGYCAQLEQMGVSYNMFLEDLVSFWPLQNTGQPNEGFLGFYNHVKFRPVAYHFCSAITRLDLEDLGGFDERYAEGIAFDDDELVARIQRKKMQINFLEYPLVLHQNHYNASKEYAVWDGKIPENRSRLDKNRILFHQTTLNETTWRANV